MVLQSATFNTSHTRENIDILITACLNTWSIEEKLIYIVRDNDSHFLRDVAENDNDKGV